MILFTEDGCSLSLYNYTSTAFVDFHCRVIFVCVNKIEAIYERSPVNVKVVAQSLRLRATLRTLPLLYLRA